MEETLRTLMEDHKKWMQEQIDAQNLQFNEQQKQMLEQQQQHQLLMGQIMEQLQNGDGRSYQRMGNGDQGVRNSVLFNPKVEFPCFDGNDPKGWIKKCTRYFTLCKIVEDQKVDLAALHLKG